MDNLTHSLVGALIGQAGLKRKTGLAMPALIIGANIPDIDAACFLWLDGVQHLGFRRGITHGPIAMVVLPLLLAGGLWWFDRWQAKRGTRPKSRLGVNFVSLFALAFLATLTHPALDWLNVYGVRLLEPFSSRWFYGDTLFIIDVWLWALMGVGLWLSLRREMQGRDWRTAAQVALALSVAYIGLNGAITWGQREIVTGLREPYPREAIVAPVALAFWRREVIIQIPEGPWVSSDWTGHVDLYGYHRSEGRQCKLVYPGGVNPDLEAFLFWSRASFTEEAADGSVLVRDARYYDPLARDRFTVALPDVRCEPL